MIWDRHDHEEALRFESLDTPSSPEEEHGYRTTSKKCGQRAQPLIPRWEMYFACVLPEGHNGEHRGGGNCFKHGEYVGKQCPHFPNCINEETTPMPMNDRSMLNAPRPYNPYQGPRLPLMTDAEIGRRADYYAKGYEDMDRLREGALRGYQREERMRLLAVGFWGIVISAAAVVAIIGLYGLFVWASKEIVSLVMGR